MLARQEAIAELAEIIEIVNNGSKKTRSGSWEWEEVYRDPGRRFQILVARDYDGRARPMPPHSHDEMEIFNVMEGAILVGGSKVVTKGERWIVPPHETHSPTPLRGLHAVVFLIPSAKIYEVLADMQHA